jgi:hypothetical protein
MQLFLLGVFFQNMAIKSLSTCIGDILLRWEVHMYNYAMRYIVLSLFLQ